MKPGVMRADRRRTGVMRDGADAHHAQDGNDGADGEALLALRGVSRVYRNGRDAMTVLHGVDLTIYRGELVAIMGHSGSGKSTLLNILGCLDRPTAGSYRIAGQDVRAMDADALAGLRREYFGFVFQRYDLLPHLSAVDNVSMPALYAGVAASVRHARACELLTGLGLAHRLDYRPDQLSGGQQQRVSIARALINGGTVILADEPTGALDRASHQEVLTHLRELNRRGHTIVIVTHDPDVAAHADRIIEIRDGRIVADRQVAPAQPRVGAPRLAPAPEAPRRLRFDRARTALAMAWAAMRSHRLRTALTMLGIVIGIASVIAVTGLGEGAKRRVVADLRTMGTHTIDVFPGKDWSDDSPQTRRALVAGDLPALSALPYVDSVSPVVSDSAMLRFGNIKLNVEVIGVGSDHFRVTGTPVAAGTSFSEEDIVRRSQVVVIDRVLRDRLFGVGADALGEIVLVGQVPCRVIGVIAPRKSLLGDSPVRRVWMPYSTQMSRLSTRDHFDSIRIRLKPGQGKAQARDVERMVRKRHGRDDVFVSTNDDIVKSVEQAATTLTLMVSAIAVISLVVGGVGVMNIMLVSVSERTREIGIRMAVGARQRDIQQQFLIEAVLICVIGGVFGVALAWSIGAIVGLFQDAIAMHFSLFAVAGACLTATLTGVGFGFVPARNAARLDPIVALARG